MKCEIIPPKKSLVNVLGVVYVHTKTSDGGDIYLTRFAEPYQKHLEIENWYEREWFSKHKIKLLGTSSVYKVPSKPIDGNSVELVVKNSRVGEDVPLNTHTLQEFCSAEFNSPWEEFALVMEMREGRYGSKETRLNTQRPLAIYVPPERMQMWQSGRSRSKINRIRARHPGIDLDILKQYKLIYEWIHGKNLIETFELIEIGQSECVEHLQTINDKVITDMNRKGYMMADMKSEHVIIGESDIGTINKINNKPLHDKKMRQIEILYQTLHNGTYSVIDYELLFRTPEHEDFVKHSRRYSYLEDQRNRSKATPLPPHLDYCEIFGVPYIYGHAESTGGHLWVVGRNARLFDYFLPERWRKTPSFSLSSDNEVFYTVTKDNIHLVWKTSRVGEFPQKETDQKYNEKIRKYGINSPFEEFALAHELNRIGIHCVYVRAIYMTGGTKVEPSADLRKYESHKHIKDTEGNPVLQENHNYISIRGYYNGPDEWVPEHEGKLYKPIDLSMAARKGVITEAKSVELLNRVVERLRKAGYDGSLLEANDILLTMDDEGCIVANSSSDPDLIICNMELIWKMKDNA